MVIGYKRRKNSCRPRPLFPNVRRTSRLSTKPTSLVPDAIHTNIAKHPRTIRFQKHRRSSRNQRLLLNTLAEPFSEEEQERRAKLECVQQFSNDIPEISAVPLAPSPPLPRGNSELEGLSTVNRKAERHFRRTWARRGRRQLERSNSNGNDFARLTALEDFNFMESTEWTEEERQCFRVYVYEEDLNPQ